MKNSLKNQTGSMETLKLISNFLLTNNYSKTRILLAQKTGVFSESIFSEAFHDYILKGDWEKVLNEFQTMQESVEISYAKVSSSLNGLKHSLFEKSVPKDISQLILFQVHEQIYLELLDEDKITEAVTVLRSHLSSFRHIAPRRVNQLSYALMETDSSIWQRDLQWNRDRQHSRLLLLNRFRFLLYHKMQMEMDPHRLSYILDLGMREQMTQCVTHRHDANSVFQPDHNISYIRPHLCDKMHLPCKSLYTLSAIKDCCAVRFSPDGKYLAAVMITDGTDTQRRETAAVYARAMARMPSGVMDDSSLRLNIPWPFRLILFQIIPTSNNKPTSLISSCKNDFEESSTLPAKFVKLAHIDFEASCYRSQYRMLQWHSNCRKIAFLCVTELLVFEFVSNSTFSSTSTSSSSVSPGKVTLNLCGRCDVAGLESEPFMCFLPNTNLILVTTNEGKLKIVSSAFPSCVRVTHEGIRMKTLAALLHNAPSSSATPLPSGSCFNFHGTAQNNADSQDTFELKFTLFWADYTTNLFRSCSFTLLGGQVEVHYPEPDLVDDLPPTANPSSANVAVLRSQESRMHNASNVVNTVITSSDGEDETTSTGPDNSDDNADLNEEDEDEIIHYRQIDDYSNNSEEESISADEDIELAGVASQAPEEDIEDEEQESNPVVLFVSSRDHIPESDLPLPAQRSQASSSTYSQQPVYAVPLSQTNTISVPSSPYSTTSVINRLRRDDNAMRILQLPRQITVSQSASSNPSNIHLSGGGTGAGPRASISPSALSPSALLSLQLGDLALQAVRQGYDLHLLRLLATFLDTPNSPNSNVIPATTVDAQNHASSQGPSISSDISAASLAPHLSPISLYTDVDLKQGDIRTLSHNGDDQRLHDICLSHDFKHVFTSHPTVIRRWSCQHGTLLREYVLEGCPPRSKLDMGVQSFSVGPHSEYIAAFCSRELTMEQSFIVIWHVDQSHPVKILPFDSRRKSCSPAYPINMNGHIRPRVHWHPTDPTLMVSLHCNGTVSVWGHKTDNPFRSSTRPEGKQRKATD